MDTNADLNPSRDTIYLKHILQELWNRKILYYSVTAACLAAAVIAIVLVPKKYTATTLISATSDSSSSPGGVLGSLSSGISALAGISMSTDPRKLESIAILQSEALTERYIQNNNLLPILFSQVWDETRSRWTNTDPAKTPTPWAANQYFQKYVRTVATDGKTGLVTMTITWTDPIQAAAWANGLVAMANEYERDTAISASEENIHYLTDQAAHTDVLGIKQVIYSLLQTEFDKAMLARGNREYAFKILDPASVPEKASYPQKTVWLLAALFAGLSLSVFIAFCRVAWR